MTKKCKVGLTFENKLIQLISKVKKKNDHHNRWKNIDRMNHCS